MSFVPSVKKKIGPDILARTAILDKLLEDFIFSHARLSRRFSLKEIMILARMSRIGHPIPWTDFHSLGLVATENGTWILSKLEAKRCLRRVGTGLAKKKDLYELTDRGLEIGENVATIISYIEDNLGKDSVEHFKRVRDFLEMVGHDPFSVSVKDKKRSVEYHSRRG